MRISARARGSPGEGHIIETASTTTQITLKGFTIPPFPVDSHPAYLSSMLLREQVSEQPLRNLAQVENPKGASSQDIVLVLTSLFIPPYDRVHTIVHKGRAIMPRLKGVILCVYPGRRICHSPCFCPSEHGPKSSDHIVPFCRHGFNGSLASVAVRRSYGRTCHGHPVLQGRERAVIKSGSSSVCVPIRDHFRYSLTFHCDSGILCAVTQPALPALVRRPNLIGRWEQRERAVDKL
jgi:hypothetical protein